jgi:hypothetical protein
MSLPPVVIPTGGRIHRVRERFDDLWTAGQAPW